jgi:hypothetical protein
METNDLFAIYCRPLNKAGLVYMATGSVACMIYGIPRFTHDLDLVIELKNEQIANLVRLFPPTEFYCPPVEVIRMEAFRATRGHFNLIHHDSGFKADVYLHNEDALQAWGLQERRFIEVDKEDAVWIAPPEYVILRKLEFFREGQSEKHILDIRGIQEVSGDLLRTQILKDWAAKRGLMSELDFALPEVFKNA